MSSSTATSTQSSTLNRVIYRGIPAKCSCGLDARIYTARTQENPGRRFYRCESKKDSHLFKWVEEAVLEEIEDALPKIVELQSQFGEVRRLLLEVNWQAIVENRARQREIHSLKRLTIGLAMVMALCFIVCIVTFGFHHHFQHQHHYLRVHRVELQTGFRNHYIPLQQCPYQLLHSRHHRNLHRCIRRSHHLHPIDELLRPVVRRNAERELPTLEEEEDLRPSYF